MKSVFEMTGVERAAALLVALGPEIASDIMRHLDEESIEKISLEIAKINRLTSEDKEDLIGQFLIDLRKSGSFLYGGESRARELLIESFGEEKAERIIKKLTKIDAEKEFDFLKDVDTDIIAAFLNKEQPHVAAVTLSYLPPEKSASVLKALDPEIAKSSAIRMAKMNKVSPEALAGVARALKKRYNDHLKNKHEFHEAGGIDTLSEMMKYMSGDEERRLMNFFDKSIPDISNRIREKIFTFENIINLNNSEIRILIDEINDDHLIAKALKGAGDEIRFKILRNMSQNRATDIITDMNAMGPIRLNEVEDCRRIIVTIMRELSDNGVISLTKDKEIYIE